MFVTERLHIQAWRPTDGEAFFQLLQDEGFHSHTITIYRQSDLATAQRWLEAETESFLQTGLGMLAVWEKTGALIGMAGLKPPLVDDRVEITYRLRQSAWGKGYATEAARTLLDYGFHQLQLPRIAASITPDNTASRKVLAKLGMHLTNTEILKGVLAEIYAIEQASWRG